MDESKKQNDRGAEGYLEIIAMGTKRILGNPALWFWGILLPVGVSPNFLFSFSSGNQQPIPDQEAAVLDEMGVIMWQYWQYIVLIIGILCLAGWLFSTVSRAGVIRIFNVQQNDSKIIKVNFMDVWIGGKDKIWSIMKLDIFILFSLAAIAIVLFLPIALLFFAQRYQGVQIMGRMAYLFYLPVGFLAVFIRFVGVIHIVLADLSGWSSVERSYAFFVKNFSEAIKIIFLSLALNFVKISSFFIISFGVVFFFSGLSFVLSFLGLALGAAWNILMFFLISLAIIIGIVSIKSFFDLLQQDVWLWWTKKYGGIKTDEVEIESKISIKGTEPAIG